MLNTPHGGVRTRSVDAGHPAVVRQAGDISVVVEQVQRPAFIGHLVGAVGPDDDPQGVPVHAGPGLRSLRGEDRRPVHGRAHSPAGALVVVPAQGVDGEPRLGEAAEVGVHRRGQHSLGGTGAADRRRLKLQLRLTRCGPTPTRLDQVPDAGGTGHRVEQIRALPSPREFRPGRTGTTAVRRRSPAAPAPDRAGRSVTVPRSVGFTPRPAIGAPWGEERRPQDGVARRASRVRVVAARERRTGQRVELVRGEQVQRASAAVAAPTNDQHLAIGRDAADTVAGPVGALVTRSAQEGRVCALAGELN